jgi:hypothetical protein
VAFVTVQNDYAQAMNIRQGFVTFQTLIDEVNPFPESGGIEQGMDATDRVGAADGFSEPVLPEASPGRQFEGIEASHPSPEQDRRRFYDRRRGDTWLPSPIRDRRDEVLGKVKNLFRIRNEAAENGLSFPFPKPIPFQLRDLFDEVLHLLVTADSLANSQLPRLGHTDLARFPDMALNQIEGLVWLALCTATV